MSKPSTHDGDVSFIRALAELLQQNDLTEIEVKREYGESDRLNVRVSRRGEAQAPSPAPSAPQTPLPPQSQTGSPSGPTAPAVDPANDPNAVTSPMVGTVYLQAEPGKPAFVGVGSKVSEGDTLLIIEAMKTMNQIPSPRSGTVKRILIEDGAPVEFGAPLMIVE